MSDLSKFSDIQLLNELINRNGKSVAPVKTERFGDWFSTLIAVGNDETAEITFTDDVDAYLGRIDKK